MDARTLLASLRARSWRSLSFSAEYGENLVRIIYTFCSECLISDVPADRQMESPEGSKLRQMAPSILHEPVPGNDKSRGVVTWMCLPYFSLQKYAENLSGLPSSSHPIRTLLQSHFSFAQKGRDMQQAVCKLSGTPPEHCFHIAQVWCLVLDDGEHTL